MINRVMVFTPYGPRLEPETVQAALGLAWDGPIVHHFQRDNPTGDAHQDILHQYRMGREAFLAGGYDAMLIIESDIIPPPDTLEKLAALEADLAYGVYVFRPEVRARRVINILQAYPQPARNPGESLSLHPAALLAALREREITCSGSGLGCVLIKRRVLELIDFRLHERDRPHCDTWFTNDVFQAGFKMRADMSVLCGHKDVDGATLYPLEAALFEQAYGEVVTA